MTLTSAACPLTDVIEDQSRTALVGGGLVKEIKINWVWNPPWGPDKITEDGREQLRALGLHRLTASLAVSVVLSASVGGFLRELI